MKLLREIVKQEIDEFYKEIPRLRSDGVLMVNIGRLNEDSLFRKEQALKRLQEDPAMVELCGVIVGKLIAISSMTNPKIEYTQAIVEAITIWENANNKFNEQLKSGERSQM